MSASVRLSRRQVLGGLAAGSAASVVGLVGGNGLATALAARKAPALIQSKGKLTYWGGLIFSDDANNLQEKTIKDWGKQNGYDIDVVMINQNETNTKVTAAVESGTMPDALDMGQDLLVLLSQSDQLLPLDDLFTKIGSAHGGWIPAADKSADPAMTKGHRTGIPFGLSGNMLFSRSDALKDVGLTPPPKTWEELGQWAEKAQKKPLYGMGFALSNVGDGNLQMSVLQSYGGRIADDAGKTVTLKSPETKTYLTWITERYKKGLFPPGVTTWDGAGDNNAYQSGQAVFIANTGSVAIWMQTNDTDLLKSTAYAALPSGPKGVISPVSPNLRAVPTKSKQPDAAKALIEYLSQPEFLQEYYKVAIYGPVLKDQVGFDAFKDLVHQGLADLAQHGTAPGYPDVYNTAYADFSNNFIVPKMIQRVVIDKWDLDKAIDEAQKAGEAIYAKYK